MKVFLAVITVAWLAVAPGNNWAGEKTGEDADTGRSMDILAYCRKVYGDSVGLFQIRSQGNSWHCTLGKRKYPVNMDDVCRLQYGDAFQAILANPADSYTWSCNRRPVPTDK